MRWVIGDIHGMLRPMEALLEAILGRDASARFIFVGDYINRGPDSRGVLDRLVTLPNATFLRGNHDDIFDLILSGQCFCEQETSDPLQAFGWFINHGLVNTLESYGIDYAFIEHLAGHLTASKLAEMMAVVPAAHREFLRQLRPVIEYEDAFVAHAMWGADQPDASPMEAIISSTSPLRYRTIWGRYTADQIRQDKPWRRTGFFGHTPVTNYAGNAGLLPVGGPQIVLLDTAAAMGGRLSAVCIETRQVVQADGNGMVEIGE
ncbi:MAG TPA: metallophosphoesterase [Tepidisphaeraceae bacterium]|jgi:serine/threonine protein phosphatase 1|nr:metallophosphoesterase [Tepidisphaeraceae bacterium]